MIPSPFVVRAGVRLAGVLPAALLRRAARGIGLAGYFVDRARRATVLENLAHLAPTASARDRRRLARRTFANLFDAATDLFRLPSGGRDAVISLVAVEGQEHLTAALGAGCGVVVVTPHLGPYELGGAWLAAAGYPAHAMVEEIDPETNAALALYREATGMRLVSRTSGLRESLRILRKGEILVLVADRVVGEGSEGLTVPFGSGRRSVPTGPAAFALATGAPIVVGYITRNPSGRTRYLIRLEPPIVPSPTGNAADDRTQLTAEVARRLASAVLGHPDQWFVFQPQWTRVDPA